MRKLELLVVASTLGFFFPTHALTEVIANGQEPATEAEEDQRSPETQARDAATLSRKLKADGKIEEAIAVCDEILAKFELSAVWQAHLVLLASDHRRVAGRWSKAVEDIQCLLPILDPEEPAHHYSLVGVYSSLAFIFDDFGLLDEAEEALENMNEIYALLVDPEVKHPAEARRRYLAEANVRSSRREYSRVDSAVTEALAKTVLYGQEPEQLAQLRVLRSLARFEDRRFDSDGFAAALEELWAHTRDESISHSMRLTPLLVLVQESLSSFNLDNARGLLKQAEMFLPTDSGVTQVRYGQWLALSLGLGLAEADELALAEEEVEAEALAMAKEANWANLTDLSTLLEEQVRLLFEEFNQRLVRPGGYGFFYFNEQATMVSYLIQAKLALGAGPEKKSSTEASEAAAEALAVLIAGQDCGTLTRLMGGSGSNLNEVQELVLRGDDSHAILAYFTATDKSHLFVIKTSGVFHFGLPADFIINREREKLSRYLGPPPAVREEASLARRASGQKGAIGRLSNFLVPADAAKELKDCERVTIVHGDFFGDLPFELLSLGKQGNFGRSKAITYSPSLSVSVLLAKARFEPKLIKESGANAFSFVADPEFDPNVLPAGKAELALDTDDEFVKAVVEPYGSEFSSVLLGEDATLEALKGILADAVVAELFAHGGSRGYTAVVPLTPSENFTDGVFSIDRLNGWSTSPLVVMMACGSGRAPTRYGDAGAADFAGAFFRSRSQCVIETPYEVDLEVARRVTKELSRSLALGETPAEALRNIRRQLAEDERFADPFYHSLIRVVGSGHDALFVPEEDEDDSKSGD